MQPTSFLGTYVLADGVLLLAPSCQAHSLKYSRRAARTAFLAFFLLLVSRAFADNSKISPDLQPLLANPSNNINVIVQYNTPPQQSSGGLLGGLLGGVVESCWVEC